MKVFLSLAVLFFCQQSLINAQQIDFTPANNGETFVTCDGFIIDSGGQGGLGYSNNESFTITVCPDTITSGDNSLYLTVIFNFFQLNGTNTGTQQNPNVDYMAVYDGTNVSSTSLGLYNTNQLQNVSIAATNANGSGCLTFVFYSNGQGTGQFTGSATCTTPCDPPTAAGFIVDGDTNDSIRVCIGVPVTFDGSASTAADGYQIAEYSWNFFDGTVDNTSGSVVTHDFDSPGQYQVQLTLTDNNMDNPCSNLNVVPLKVYVSTYPTYNDFPADTIICVGETVELLGIADFGQYDSTWTGFPGTDIIDDGCLTDDQLGVAQTIPITYTEFDPSDVVGSVDDIVSVCVNMEHSYMGDLVVQLTCPNGTTINLQNQGGGGTQIGIPDQADDVNCDLQTGFGEGFDYCWDNNSPQTWTQWVNTNGGGGTLPSGNYATADPLSNLVGCPLSGTWQITVVDNFAADDGTIFELGVTFAPEFYPDIVQFTNTIGASSDSSFWDLSDPYIVSNSDDLNFITVTPTDVGVYSYTYSVVNNFGCPFDSTVTISVVEPPIITAGPDLNVCNDPVQLQAGFPNAPAPSCSSDGGTYSYCYGDNENITVTYCPDVPGDGITSMQLDFLSGEFESFSDGILIYDGDDFNAPLIGNLFFGSVAGESYVANNATGCLTMVIFSDISISCESQDFDPIELSVSCVSGSNNLVWSWTPTVGLSNPNVQNPLVLVNQSTTYTVSAHAPGLAGCAGTDQVTVSPDEASDPGVNNDTTFCYNSPISALTSYLAGTPATSGSWTNNDGDPINAQFNPTQYPQGAFFNYFYEVVNGNCVNNSELNITVLAATDNSCCQTNAQAGQDAVACALSYELDADNVLGLGTWSGPENVSFSDIHDPNAIVTAASPGGSITLTWTDNNGLLCSESDAITIQFSDPLELLVITEEAQCFNTCTGKAIVIADGGTAPGASYTLDWFDSGTSGLIAQTRDSICEGTHMVKIFDNFGCSDSALFVIDAPEEQEIFTTFINPLCADSCNGKVSISSPGAVDYSFNGGDTYQVQSTKLSCAGEFTILARNQKGCTISENVSLLNPPKFTADFNVNPIPATTRNTTITFQDISLPGPIKLSQYFYGHEGALGTATTRIASYTFPKDTAGTYPVTLISTNTNGCIDTLVKDVVINEELLWFIPNSFTPNEDGINDIWKPVGSYVDLTNYRLVISDRWGRQLFTTTDFEQGWRGNAADSEYYVDTGVYNYVIKVSSKTTEEKFEITGFITVVR